MTPDELSLALTDALRAAVTESELSVARDAIPAQVKVERPKNREHGDWATNIALQLAKSAGVPPRTVAEILKARLEAIAGVSRVEIAGPGFLNITLDAAAAGALAKNIVIAGARYGQNDSLAGQVINLEFISANPTGPLHLAHTRWAAVGDSLARVLRASGAKVSKEYYINDAGSQMNNFAASVLASIKGEPTPEGGYPGSYIDDLAHQVLTEHPAIRELTEVAALPVVRQAAYQAQMADIKETLEAFGVHFDVFFSEQSLHSSGAISQAVDRLRAQGHVFDQDGAVWLRTTDFTDDKDRVLIRANGEPTYFSADAAYYLSKKDRGFDQKIYLLGADHHGYIGRLKAIAACAGDDPEHNIEVLIGQMVSVNGARLSKRAGNIVELRDLLNWLGADALRYSLGRSPANSPLSLEPEQLQKASNDNPVFYVQYAHARTKAVDRNAEAAGVGVVSADFAFDASLLEHPTESELLAALGSFPSVVAEAAKFREPHRVARHLEVIAGAYHRWYDACRVTPQGEEPVTDLNRTRLWLNDATGQVLANGLDLLGVTAPERM
ncbi:arginine--tRNA ligase [Psychromicrobium lacuslunae]|uniref:Arginine--tRNA ligase n=1 Tax=Psychromicrobium lacuslunae TaxID=1618207 RepID=A0A0D4BY13_9MICC|nr:arginine--tRNA ligase [Psychromicrobium lacuslunae]AJT41357.1 arginine--tRNA ligase [Psychromicrobium lacuslunae]